MSGGHGAPGGRRKKHEEHEEHVNHERWLVSYADFMTVLMALFIVLFAMSQVDAQKFQQLRKSLASGFSSADSVSVLDGSQGVLDDSAYLDSPAQDALNADLVTADAMNGMQASNPTYVPTDQGSQGASGASLEGADAADVAAAQAEASHLEEVKAAISGALSQSGLQDKVRFTITDRGLVMGLVADDVFFAAASADLTAAAMTVLDSSAPVLRGLSEQISVEGHANTLPVSGRYATNWELSTDRATQVLRRFVEHDAVPGGRIQAVGFGDTRPLVAGDTPEALEANRRVDIVVLSSAPDQVRALVPTIANASNGH
ncbi:OmpA/MotB family protein [Cellulomonas endophytica]|uniref:OmpA/MotB family protein n=1 Tax=Cellulomonas endophytica TaxID=2494735 RepID=UPI001010C89D|nr:flagellar motor protein MotB [Cellulomonas endophytica]